MSSHRSLAWLGLGLPLFVACAKSEGASSASEDVTAKPQEPAPGATVTSTNVAQDTNACKVHVGWPVVDAGNAAVNAAIAGLLPVPTVASFCANLLPGEVFAVDVTFLVETRERGILSLIIIKDMESSNAPHPTIRLEAFTIDLRTGKRLLLADVLDATGLATARASCTDELAKSLADNLGDTPAKEHAAAAKLCASTTSENPLGFTVDEAGLHLELDINRAEQSRGETSVPWSKLTNGLRPGPVADFVHGISK